MSKRISLLERYEIDIEKLDYGYIESCNDVRELEKIYKILLSNEEGFYPDLTAAAKERLRTIQPSSKCLRTEERVQRLQSDQEKELKQFLKSVKKNEKQFLPKDKAFEREFPCVPIRGHQSDHIEIVPINQKYPRDESFRKIEEIHTDNLSTSQLQQLEANYRSRANNHFKAKEYSEALKGYEECIEVLPTPQGFNNRGITYMKLNRFEEAVADLDQCLSLDPTNTKALLRKADCLSKLNRKTEALQIHRIINDEKESAGKCSVAKESNLEMVKTETKSTPNVLAEGLKRDLEEADYAKLIRPKKIVQSKSKTLVEGLKKMNKNMAKESKGLGKKEAKVEEELKVLIEEV